MMMTSIVDAYDIMLTECRHDISVSSISIINVCRCILILDYVIITVFHLHAVLFKLTVTITV